MDQLLLKEKVAAILNPDDYAGIQEWYRDIIMGGDDYVIFMVRRSYLLALIMEKVTGLNMEENSNAVFLTDSSAILFCSELARQYKETGEFPKILLCDDTLIHGRAINHFLEDMEETLYNLLPDYKKDNILEALVKSVQIQVYIKSDMLSLILSRYELNTRYKRKENNAYIHRFSNDISSLVLASGMANTVYIYSRYLSYKDFGRLNLEGFIETSYQNTKQYTRIQYIGLSEEKKAVITLRIVKDNGNEGYRVIPFIFLPNLGEEETAMLIDSMASKMEDAGINRNYIKLLYYLKDIPGKRAFNELVTLWLSQAVLQEFNKLNGMGNVLPDEDEICKLARNFNCGCLPGFNSLEVYKDMLRVIVSKQVFSISDIADMAEDSVQYGRKLLYVTKCSNSYVSEKEKKRIKYKLENYFYYVALEEEKDAYSLSKNPYYHTKRRSKRNVRGCGFLLRELNDGYTEIKAAYSIAYFLQMVDAGVLSLSSYAYKEVKVVGFSQFAKAGEQSLLLMPLRMYEWLPLINEIQLYCKWCGCKFEEEIYGYLDSEGCDASSGLIEEIEEIVKFVAALSSIGQEAVEWMGYYINKIELDILEGETLRKARFRFLEKQLLHAEQYKNYRKI